MAWAKLDDGLDEHRKVEQLLEGRTELGMLDGDALQELAGLAAIGLWTLGLTNTSRRLTEGHLSKRVLRALAPTTHQLLADRLVEVGLFDADPTGVHIHDYLDHNPSRDQAVAQKTARSEAGRRGGQRSGQARRKATGQANASPVASGSARSKTEPRTRTRTPIPPVAPQGGRARDRTTFEEQLTAWTEEHLPGADPQRVRAVAEHIRSRHEEPTAQAIVAFAAERPRWAIYDQVPASP